MNKHSRRSVLAAGVGLGVAAIMGRSAEAAEFNYKIASDNPPSDSTIIRLNEACERILSESGGRLSIRVFPSSQLGNTNEELAQLRSGALEFYFTTFGIVSSVVPVCSICTLGFLFDDAKAAFAAMDGELGRYLEGEVEKTRAMTVVSKPSDAGFRHIVSGAKAIRQPSDLKGFKIRTPPNPVLTSLFSALGASPTVISYSDLYTALQTKLVDGCDNPIFFIEALKAWEVQKHVTLDGHTWDAWTTFASRRAWDRLPSDLQAIVRRNLDIAQLAQREDAATAQREGQARLAEKGMTIIKPEPGLFRDALRATDFYSRWKDRYGAEAWAVLERVAKV